MAAYRECYFPEPGVRRPNPNPPGEDPPASPHNPAEWAADYLANGQGGGARRATTTASGPAGVVSAGSSVALDSAKWGLGRLRNDFGGMLSSTIIYAIFAGIVGLVLSKVVDNVPIVDGTAGWISLVALVLLPAYVQSFLDVARFGGSVRLTETFRSSRWIKALPVSILVAITIAAGSALFVVPGLIAAVFLSAAIWFAVDDSPSPVAAVTGSVAMVRQNVGSALLLVLISAVIIGIGTALCGVGLLLAVPTTTAMWTCAYLTMRGEYVQS